MHPDRNTYIKLCLCKHYWYNLVFLWRLSYLPRSALVAFVAVPVDVLMISAVALWKSPCMLLKGWQRLCEDLVGREGPFLETVCVPFAGLAIILWPLAVIGGIIASFFSSFLFGFRAGLIAYQVCLASFLMKKLPLQRIHTLVAAWRESLVIYMPEWLYAGGFFQDGSGIHDFSSSNFWWIHQWFALPKRRLMSPEVCFNSYFHNIAAFSWNFPPCLHGVASMHRAFGN